MNLLTNAVHISYDIKYWLRDPHNAWVVPAFSNPLKHVNNTHHIDGNNTKVLVRGRAKQAANIESVQKKFQEKNQTWICWHRKPSNLSQKLNAEENCLPTMDSVVHLYLLLSCLQSRSFFKWNWTMLMYDNYFIYYHVLILLNLLHIIRTFSILEFHIILLLALLTVWSRIKFCTLQWT